MAAFDRKETVAHASAEGGAGAPPAITAVTVPAATAEPLVFSTRVGKIKTEVIQVCPMEISVAPSEPVSTQTAALLQLPNHKVKIKKPGQRACNEKNDKGKFCGGHLKRWFYTTDVLEQECGCVEKAWGTDAEVYRCEFCQTLYLPSPEDARGVNVGGVGQRSVFGLTVPPKDEKKT